jgi:hypothetical protein
VSAQPSDFDKDATTDEGIWRECAERLRMATAAESENRIRGIDAKRFRWGDQWDADVRNARKIDGRPALTINHTNTFCQRQENTLRQQRPRIKCHPVGDGADVDTAGVVNGLIRHIEDRSTASVAYDTGVKNSVDIGWGYWRIVSEYLDPMSFDQELLIRPIRNPFTVYMDPASVFPDGRDQYWCIISETMKRAEYRRRYPKAENCEWRYVDAPGDMTLDWESKEEVRLAEYYRIHEVKDTLVKLSDGSVKYRSQLADPNVIAAVGLTIIAERPTTRRAVQWFRLNGKTVIARREDPGEHIPVIRCEGNVEDINGRVLRKGMVQDLKDPAQMFNYWRTAQTERYALTPKAPWVVAEGQIDGHPEWNDANQKSYSTLVYKPIPGPDGQTPLPPPQRVPPAQVEAGMSEAAQGAEHDLMSVAGMPQENPEISARVVSGNKYLQRRQGMQDLTHFQYYDNQTLAIAWTGVLLLERIPFYYDTKRMQRIIREDGQPEMVELNAPGESPENPAVQIVKNDMSVGRYAVVMDTGPGYATKREEATENLVELLGTPLGEQVAQTSGDIIVRNMDFYGADEVADRLAVTIPGAMDKIMEGLPKQAQTIIQSLQAQMKQKDDQLNQAMLEIKYGQGIAELKEQGALKREQMKSVTSVHNTELKVGADNANSERDYTGWIRDTDVNAGVKLEVANIQAETARDVAEIRVGGQLLNTHVEAAHESRAADKAISAAQNDRRESAGK